MVGIMRFCSERVLHYLREPKDGLVATMRNWLYRVNQRVVLRDCNGSVIGYGVVVDVAPATPENIRRWLKYSGFNTVEEWVNEARKLNKGLPQFVYLVYIMR